MVIENSQLVRMAIEDGYWKNLFSDNSQLLRMAIQNGYEDSKRLDKALHKLYI